MLDINMPIKTGIEAKKEVSKLFDEFNTIKTSKEGGLQKKQVSAQMPFVCYVTQLSEQVFHDNFILPNEEADVVLPKPLQKS